MPFRDLLKKKEKLTDNAAGYPEPPPIPDEPEFQFTFMRSDTHTQEIISPPTFSSTESSNPPSFMDGKNETRKSSLFRNRPRTTSNASGLSASSRGSDKSKSKSGHKRLS